MGFEGLGGLKGVCEGVWRFTLGVGDGWRGLEGFLGFMGGTKAT